MQAAFDAILFDFGGTLFSYRIVRRRHTALLVQAAERLGAEADEALVVGTYARASRAVAEAYRDRPFFLYRDFLRDVFRRFGEALQGEPTGPFLDWFAAAHHGLAVRAVALRPRCAETLDALGAAGLHVGIVSNIDEHYFEPMLARVGLAAHVHARTSSEEARSCKPDARIFECALEKAGGAKPERTLFVGDDLHADVYGAGRLGMHTVLVRDAGGPAPAVTDPGPVPHHVIEELPQLLSIVSRPLEADARPHSLQRSEG
jgi:putative hydrolase of the HAD superfamily